MLEDLFVQWSSPRHTFLRPATRSRKLKSMANSSRSTAQQNSDSQGGFRSLAGYVFQLYGSISEVIQLVRIAPEAIVIEEAITLERFGQDSFVSLVPGTNKSRFTQYKHSLTGDKIQPNELREILERFVVSVTLAELKINECEFVLATNRKPAEWTGRLLSAQEQYKEKPSHDNEEALKELLWKRYRRARPECEKEMLEILKEMKWLEISAEEMRETAAKRACELGVPRHDVDEQIRKTLGLFLDRVNSQSYRTISRQELDDELAGHKDARLLRCEQSRNDQRQCIENALIGIHHNKSIARREIVNDIAAASIAYPLVIVVGNGGRGKSAGAWQSLLEQLRDEKREPDFVAGRHFGEFSEIALVNEFASWRNQGPDRDGPQIGRALERLSAGCRHSNLLVLYVDGIDEKQGLVKPYPDNQRFIERFLRAIIHDRTDAQKKQVSLVVSCRAIEEADWLTRIAGEANYKQIEVDGFSDDELEELAMTLLPPVQIKLLSLVSKEQKSRRRFNDEADQQLICPLREPRVWASFVDLDSDLQIAYLSHSPEGKRQLAAMYLRRIEEKASDRLAIKLGQKVVKSILEAASKIANMNDFEVCTLSQWLEVCNREQFRKSDALMLFDEFVTGGLFKVESRDGQQWSWNQLWLRDVLCDQEEIQ